MRKNFNLSNISHIVIDIDNQKWTITEWFTKKEYMNQGYGTKVFKSAFADLIKNYGKPERIVYVWNNENEYVMRWLKKFDAKCTCPLSVLKYANDDIWEAHLYDLNIDKLIEFIR